MRRTRASFQRGCVVQDKRASGDHTWLFRWRDSSGKRKSVMFGTLSQFKNISLARAEADRLKLAEKHLGRDQAHAQGKTTLGELAERYKTEEMPQRFSTKHSCTSWLKVHILPRWGHHTIEEVADPSWLSNGLKSLRSRQSRRGMSEAL